MHFAPSFHHSLHTLCDEHAVLLQGVLHVGLVLGETWIRAQFKKKKKEEKKTSKYL